MYVLQNTTIRAKSEIFSG